MANKKTRWDSWTIVTVVIIALFALFLLHPLISLFLSGFEDTETGVQAADNYTRFFSKKYYKSALLNSSELTFSVTVIAIILGVPLAYFMSFYKIRGKDLLKILFVISMISSNFIGAYSWILLPGRSGTVTQFLKGLGIHMPSIYGLEGIPLVFTLRLYPFIYMYILGALKEISVALSETAESLGCGDLKKVLTVIMPLVTPTLIATTLLVFMNCMAGFGTPTLAGEGYRIMPTLVYPEFAGETGGSASFTACMAAIVVVVTATVFLLQEWYVNTKSFTMSSTKPIQSREVHGIKGFFAHLSIYLLAATSIIPQCMIVYASFRITKMQVFVGGFSLESCRKVFSTAIQSIKNTYLYCLAAIVTIVVLDMLIAYLVVRCKSWPTSTTDAIAVFPYIVSGSVLSITLLITFNHPPMMLAGSAITMVISLVVRGRTYTLHPSSAILYQISPGMEEAAVNLGGSPSIFSVRVTAKMMLPGTTSGVILSWIALINEPSSSVMLYTANTRTMPVVIYNEVTRASYRTAAALATTLTVTTVISLLIFFKVSGSKDVTM